MSTPPVKHWRRPTNVCGRAATLACSRCVSKLPSEIAVLRGVTVPDIVGIYAAIQTAGRSGGPISRCCCLMQGKALAPSTEVHDHADDASEEKHGTLDWAMSKLQGTL